MDGFGQSRVLDHRFHTLVQTAFIIDVSANNLKSYPGSTPHPIGKAPASGIDRSSSASLLGYEFLLELISGGDYGNITMVRRND